MFRKISIISSMLMLYTLCTVGQQVQNYVVPNYELIESETKDAKGSNYYPVLLKRYKNNDTTIDAKQVHLLYYGKFFNDDLLKLPDDFNWADSIKAVLKNEPLTDNDRRKLLDYYLHQHDGLPFDLGNLYHIFALCRQLNDPREPTYHWLVSRLLRTIAATGDGTSLKSGYHIGSVADEYSFLSLAGLDFAGSQSLIDNCDYLTVKENRHGLEGVYFNIEQVLHEERKALGMDPEMEEKVLKLLKDAKKSDDK